MRAWKSFLFGAATASVIFIIYSHQRSAKEEQIARVWKEGEAIYQAQQQENPVIGTYNPDQRTVVLSQKGEITAKCYWMKISQDQKAALMGCRVRNNTTRAVAAMEFAINTISKTNIISSIDHGMWTEQAMLLPTQETTFSLLVTGLCGRAVQQSYIPLATCNSYSIVHR